MKKITLLLITLFTTSTMLMAHGGPRRGERRNMNIKERAERMAERMTKEYALNDIQKRQVYEANLIMIADMQPLHKQGPAPRRHPGLDKKKGTDCKCDTAQMAKCGDKDTKNARKDESREKVMKEHKEKRMAGMKQSRQTYDTKLKNIFTKDQYKVYAKKQAERQKRTERRKVLKPQLPANS